MKVKKVQRRRKWNTSSINGSSLSEAYSNKAPMSLTVGERDLNLSYTSARPQKSAYRRKNILKPSELPHLNSSRRSSFAYTHPCPSHNGTQRAKSNPPHFSTSRDSIPPETSFAETTTRETVRIFSRPGSFFLTYQPPESLIQHHLFRHILQLKAHHYAEKEGSHTVPEGERRGEIVVSPPISPLDPAMLTTPIGRITLQEVSPVPLSSSMMESGKGTLVEDLSHVSIPHQHVLRLSRRSFSQETDLLAVSAGDPRGVEGELGNSSLGFSPRREEGSLPHRDPHRYSHPPRQEGVGGGSWSEADFMASQELLSIPFAEASVGSPSPCGDPSSVVRIAKGTPRPASPKPDQGDLAGVKKNVSRRLLLLPRVVRRIEGAALRDPVEGHGASRKGVRRSNAKPPAGTEKEKEKNDAEEHKPSVLEAHPRRPPLQRLGAELRQWRASLHEFKHRLHHQEERGGGEINGDEAGGEPSKIMESSASLLNYGNSTFSSTMYTQELHSLTEGDLYRSVNDYNGNVVKITDASFKEKIRMFQVNGEQPKYFVVFCIPKRERRLVFLQGAKWNFSLLRHMIRMEIHPVSGTMAKTV